MGITNSETLNIQELSKNIDGIAWIKLKENHRSGLVGKILDYVYGK